MNYDKFSEGVLDAVGGSPNIAEAYHCVTRLRLQLRDRSKVDRAKIERIDGVGGVKFSGDELQVIVGTTVKDAYDVFVKHYSPTAGPAAKAGKTSLLDRVTGFFAGVFVPIIPALIAGGLAKSLTALLTTFDLVSPASNVAILLNIVGDCAFYFLPFLLAVSVARRLHVNEYLALAVAGSLMYPTVMNGLENGDTTLGVLGVSIPLISYASSVIPIMLGVWLLSLVYRGVERIVHPSLRVVFVPLLSLLIVIPINLAFVAPLGYYAGVQISGGITWIFDLGGVVASVIIGAALPLMVMVGMHHVLGPIILGNLGANGIDYILPLFFLNTLSTSGAAIAVFVKSRNVRLKGTAFSAGLTSFLGITEPATYGVNLPLRRPFVAAMIGGGVAGGLGYALGLRAFAYAFPSVLSIPTYVSPEQGSSLAAAIVPALVSFALGFAITFFWWREKADADGVGGDAGIGSERNATLCSPVADGVVVDVVGLKDPVFSQQMMGATQAFTPRDGSVVSPARAVVVLVAETKHAVGLETEDGVEVLIHIGIDTVKLGGAPFNVKVAVGDTVEVGDELVVADLMALQQRGADNTVVMALTNKKPAEQEDLVSVGTSVRGGTPVARVRVADSRIGAQTGA